MNKVVEILPWLPCATIMEMGATPTDIMGEAMIPKWWKGMQTGTPILGRLTVLQAWLEGPQIHHPNRQEKASAITTSESSQEQREASGDRSRTQTAPQSGLTRPKAPCPPAVPAEPKMKDADAGKENGRMQDGFLGEETPDCTGKPQAKGWG